MPSKLCDISLSFSITNKTIDIVEMWSRNQKLEDLAYLMWKKGDQLILPNGKYTDISKKEFLVSFRYKDIQTDCIEEEIEDFLTLILKEKDSVLELINIPGSTSCLSLGISVHKSFGIGFTKNILEKIKELNAEISVDAIK